MRAYIVFILLFSSACSTLNKKECANMNWEDKGRSDGKKGKPLSIIDDYKETCAKHELSINEELYKQGHQFGLTHYCTYDQGYELGWNGKEVFSECESVNSEFITGFEDGHKKWMAYLESEIERRREYGRHGPRGAGRFY